MLNKKYYLATLTLDKLLYALSLTVIMLFIASLLLGIFVPLYTDEVATKMVQARFFAEGGKIVTLFPQCGASFIVDTPISWYPAAIVYSFLYSSLEPLAIRISGMVTAFAWIALSVWWVVSVISVRKCRIFILAATASILGLGVLPLLMILARSEQWLILLITLFCLFPIISRRVAGSESRWCRLSLCLAFVLVTSLFFYSHPKAIFFSPLVLVSACYTFGLKNRLLLGLSILFVVICLSQSIFFAKTVTHCKDAPKLSAILTSQTIDIGLIKSSPLKFVAVAVGNLLQAPNKIINHSLFNNDYQSGWLPAVNESNKTFAVKFANRSARTLLLACLWSALLLPLFYFWKVRSAKKADERFFIILALWIGFVGHLAIFNTWNFYSGALVLPLALWMLVLLGAEMFQVGAQMALVKKALLIIMLFSLCSFYILFSTLTPQLATLAYSDKGSLFGQPLSVATFDFQSQRLKLRALAAKCGIRGDGANRLVVDDLTYFAFDNLHQPIHMVYLYEGGFGADISGDKIAPFLAKMASSGIIAQCTYLPELYENQAERDGNYCCVKLGANK